jgi:hypothetical protein
MPRPGGPPRPRANPSCWQQRRLTRSSPRVSLHAESVEALIDALVQAGGRLATAEAASATGESPVHMSGYLAQALAFST